MKSYRLLPCFCIALLGLTIAADDDVPTETGDLINAGTSNPPSADDPIPDKVGAEVHLTKKERQALKKLECSMCKAILSEMHVEVKKHHMTQKGWGAESQVWETSNAICLGILQKYRLELSGPELIKKAGDEEEEELAAARGGPEFFRAMLVLKMGCSRWVEDYGGDVSGYIFRVVKEDDRTTESAAREFCTHRVEPPQCGAKKNEKKQSQKAKDRERSEQRRKLMQKDDVEEAKRKENNPFENLPEDSKLGLQRMLEMAKDDPLHYLEDDARKRVLQAQSDLRCDVCRTMLEDVHAAVLKKPRSMQGEEEILSLTEGACEGGKDTSIPNYFGVEPPPLPPVWTDRVRPRLDKATKKYALKRFPKKAAKARQKWRELTATGQHKPPSADEGEGDMMMTMACKAVLEPARMSEALFDEMVACKSSSTASTCNAPLQAASLICSKGEDGTLCDFGAGAGGGVSAEL